MTTLTQAQRTALRFESNHPTTGDSECVVTADELRGLLDALDEAERERDEARTRYVVEKIDDENLRRMRDLARRVYADYYTDSNQYILAGYVLSLLTALYLSEQTRDEAIAEHGNESGFWGRACARLVHEKDADRGQA